MCPHGGGRKNGPLHSINALRSPAASPTFEPSQQLSASAVHGITSFRSVDEGLVEEGVVTTCDDADAYDSFLVTAV